MHIAKANIVDRGASVALTANVTYQGRTHTVWFSVAHRLTHLFFNNVGSFDARGHRFPAALRLAALLPPQLLMAARRSLPGSIKRQIALRT